MTSETYAHEFEDFSASDLSQLDTWVFERVESFFERARQDMDLQMRLRGDRVVLFLHLLGLDTNGHTNKPRSKGEWGRQRRAATRNFKTSLQAWLAVTLAELFVLKRNYFSFVSILII